MKTSTPQYSEFIHKSRYAKWIESENRRETWEETVQRYMDYFHEEFHTDTTRKRVRDAIINLDVMPSMRALMSAGKAAESSEVALYNCAYIACDDPFMFSEVIYILMNGTGLGFSVERQYICKLPLLPKGLKKVNKTIIVGDSKEGWATAYDNLISTLYAGEIPKFDISQVRAKGKRLKTFGGRASGSGPLVDLFKFTINVFKNATGEKLKSIECHDIVCKIASIVVCGGVRRSALISLSNLTDHRMANAKSGDWWVIYPQRALANNSVNYTEKPEVADFMDEFKSLYKSKSGERGIFSSHVAKLSIPKRRKGVHKSSYGCNPCSEIILRDTGQFCNLSEVIVRPHDTYESLAEKVEIASIIGTVQSTKTNFKYIRKQWRDNCEEERLLGVSLTGVCDHYVMRNTSHKETLEIWLKGLKETAIETNKKHADLLGINHSKSITCVKPSGTVSQLVDSASGVHPRYSEYYIRTVRSDTKDPLAHMLIAQGIPHEPCHMNPNDVVIFSFPIHAPSESIMRNDKTALEQLDMWKVYQLNWCEHKVSITVYVKEHEWISVMAWVWENFDIVSGISFLPHSDHSYSQAPYQEINKEEYEKLKAELPAIDWSKLPEFEKYDTTTPQGELACAGGACEIK